MHIALHLFPYKIKKHPSKPSVREGAGVWPGPIGAQKIDKNKKSLAVLQARKGPRTESTLAEITVVLVQCCYSTRIL